MNQVIEITQFVARMRDSIGVVYFVFLTCIGLGLGLLLITCI